MVTFVGFEVCAMVSKAITSVMIDMIEIVLNSSSRISLPMVTAQGGVLLRKQMGGRADQVGRRVSTEGASRAKLLGARLAERN